MKGVGKIIELFPFLTSALARPVWLVLLDVLHIYFFIYIYYYHKKFKGEIMMTLIERTNKFLDELGVTVTAFARRVRLSPQAIYGWRGGRLVLSDASLKRIEDHLSKYGF